MRLKRASIVVAAVCSIIACARLSLAGCDQDADCGSGRVCERGVCVSLSGSGESEDNRSPTGGARGLGGRPQKPPQFCCTKYGKLGPYANSELTEDEECVGTHSSRGEVPGKVCY